MISPATPSFVAFRRATLLIGGTFQRHGQFEDQRRKWNQNDGKWSYSTGVVINTWFGDAVLGTSARHWAFYVLNIEHLLKVSSIISVLDFIHFKSMNLNTALPSIPHLDFSPLFCLPLWGTC